MLPKYFLDFLIFLILFLLLDTLVTFSLFLPFLLCSPPSYPILYDQKALQLTSPASSAFSSLWGDIHRRRISELCLASSRCNSSRTRSFWSSLVATSLIPAVTGLWSCHFLTLVLETQQITSTRTKLWGLNIACWSCVPVHISEVLL